MNNFESSGEKEEREKIQVEDATGQEKYYLTSGRRVSKELYAIARFVDVLEEMRTPEEKKREPYYSPMAEPVKLSPKGGGVNI